MMRLVAKYQGSNIVLYKENIILDMEARIRRRCIQTSAYFFHFGATLEKDPSMSDILQQLMEDSE